jgi:hypothetical protein
VQRELTRAQTMDELPQDSRGRILFGLELSVVDPAVSTLQTSRRDERPASLVPFRR